MVVHGGAVLGAGGTPTRQNWRQICHVRAGGTPTRQNWRQICRVGVPPAIICTQQYLRTRIIHYIIHAQYIRLHTHDTQYHRYQKRIMHNFPPMVHAWYTMFYADNINGYCTHTIGNIIRTPITHYIIRAKQVIWYIFHRHTTPYTHDTLDYTQAQSTDILVQKRENDYTNSRTIKNDYTTTPEIEIGPTGTIWVPTACLTGVRGPRNIHRHMYILTCVCIHWLVKASGLWKAFCAITLSLSLCSPGAYTLC